MSSTESAQKIILALVAAAGIILLGPYLGISIFGRGVTDLQTLTTESDGEDVPRPIARSAAKPADLELELPNTNSAETRKPSTDRSGQEISDLDDLLKSK